MQKALYFIWLMCLAPSIQAQFYIWPAQAWDERDAINPAAVQDSWFQFDRPLTLSISARKKQFHPGAANWQTGSFALEYIGSVIGQASWIAGGKAYFDQFGPTKFTYGSLRSGVLKPLGRQAFISAAFQGSFESFKIQSDDLYLLQSGDPLQYDNPQPHYNLGVGIFYRFDKKHDIWGFHAGVSMPFIFHPTLTTSGEKTYAYHPKADEWYLQASNYFTLGNRKWVEWSALMEMKVNNMTEGSFVMRYRWLSADNADFLHGWTLGVGLSTWQYLCLETSFLFRETVKLSLGYDYKLSPVVARSIPVQITVACFLGRRD